MREVSKEICSLLERDNFNVNIENNDISAIHRTLPIRIKIGIKENMCELHVDLSAKDVRETLIEEVEENGFESVIDKVEEVESIIEGLSLMLKKSCKKLKRDLEGLFDLRDIITEIEEELFE